MKHLLAVGMGILLANVGVAARVPWEETKGWTIVVAPDASPSERYAAEEFRALFQEALGVELPLSHDPAARQEVFRIGPGASENPAARFGEEELLIQVRPNDVLITGGRPRGTLYGVYEFFERYLGCQFLTYDQTWFPKPAALKPLPVEEYPIRQSVLVSLELLQENADHPEFAVRQRINTIAGDERLGGKTPQNLINHSYYKWVRPEKYGQKHPEYFALVDGVRQTSGEGGGPQPCPTDPSVIDIVTQGVLDELAQNPGLRNISVSQNDNGLYCQCPRCEAINTREGSPAAANLTLVNGVAERVEKTHPEVMIGTLTYWYTRKPPWTIRPRHNVQIQLCSIECCTLHAINDRSCPKNRAFCDDLNGWKDGSEDIWIWNYDTNFGSYDLPFPNLRSIGPNVAFFRDNHAKGVFMQANGNGNGGEFCDLRNYVISKCLWKPGLDSWALTENFCRLHYGRAADDILAWLQIEHQVAEEMGAHPGCGPTPDNLGLSPKIVREALACFARAREKADDSAIRSRVEKASVCAYKAALLTAPVSWRYADGRVSKVPSPENSAPLDAYSSLCATFHVTMHSESTPIDQFLKQFNDPSPIPATQLENEVWRITVAPKLNGAMVGLLHKPSGRQLLRAMQTADLSKGRLETFVTVGAYTRLENMECDLEKSKNAITLTKKLSDGTREERVIRLSAEAPEKVQVAFRLIQGGKAPQIWRFYSQPGWDPGTATKDPQKLTVYAQADEWKVVNRGWHVDDGPEAETLRNAKGGGLAFYNHEARFGALITYVPAEVGQLYMFWHPERPQLNMDLRTPTVTLNPGQTLQLHYTIQYLGEPPI